MTAREKCHRGSKQPRSVSSAHLTGRSHGDTPATTNFRNKLRPLQLSPWVLRWAAGIPNPAKRIFLNVGCHSAAQESLSCFLSFRQQTIKANWGAKSVERTALARGSSRFRGGACIHLITCTSHHHQRNQWEHINIPTFRNGDYRLSPIPKEVNSCQKKWR